MEEDSMQRRRELYEEFKATLSRPLRERYYDEDDLADIFDYAADTDDYYTQTEALLCAARLFPDSELMNERKLVYYADMEGDTATQFLADHADQHDFLYEINRLRLSGAVGAQAKRALDDLIGSYDNLGDEDVIQLVRAAESLGVPEWVYDHLNMLRKKVSYEPTLIYEAEGMAERDGRYDKATELMQEMTEIEPFTADYWSMLAQNQIELGHIDDATTSVEYALAIDPDSAEALKVRSRLLYTRDNKDPEAIETMRRVCADDPTDITALHVLTMMCIDSGNTHIAMPLLSKAIDADPGNIDLLRDAVLAQMPRLDEIFGNYHDHTSRQGENAWAPLVESLLELRLYAECVTVIQGYEKASGKHWRQTAELPLSLFMLRRYTELNAYFRNTYTLPHRAPYGADAPLLYVLMLLGLLRTGDIAAAADLCHTLTTTPLLSASAESSAHTRMEMQGALSIVALVSVMLDKHGDVDWNTFDPLGLFNA